MRTYKFRCWEPHIKKMLSNDEIYLFDGHACYKNEYDHIGVQDGIVMQFIDFLDRNKKEIYDRDLISEGTLGSLIWQDCGKLIELPYGEVFWDHHSWNIKLIKNGRVKMLKDCEIKEICGDIVPFYMSHFDNSFEWDNDIEVIGNIYNGISKEIKLNE